MTEPLIILGAGASGLSAAAHAGGAVPLFEQALDVGGLCRSYRRGGYRFDEIAHVLYFHDAGAQRLVRSLLGDNLAVYDRQARVYWDGRYGRYPFQAHLHGLPPAVRKECLDGRRFADRALRGAVPDSFDAWTRQQLGPGVARHFMTPYNTKFWTLPPSEMTWEWARRFVPVPSYAQMLRGARCDDPAEYGYNARFVYPRAGGVAALMAALVKRAPGLRLGKRVISIDVNRARVIFADGDAVEYRRAITTIPLPELARVLCPLPDAIAQAFNRLRWVSLYALHLGLRGGPAPCWDWAYFPQPEIAFFRVGCPSRYAPDSAPEGCWTLSVEASYSAWQPLRSAGLVSRIMADLRRVGLITPASVVEVRHPVAVGYGYPIYDHDYHAATEAILAFLKAHGIFAAGRFGRWAYFSLEDSLLDGMRAAHEAAAIR